MLVSRISFKSKIIISNLPKSLMNYLAVKIKNHQMLITNSHSLQRFPILLNFRKELKGHSRVKSRITEGSTG